MFANMTELAQRCTDFIEQNRAAVLRAHPEGLGSLDD